MHYLLTDHLGSTLATVETAGASQVRYKAWGEQRVDGTLPTRRKFTGQLEAETGLYFYNARYDPTLGRSLLADTVVP